MQHEAPAGSDISARAFSGVALAMDAKADADVGAVHGCTARIEQSRYIRACNTIRVGSAINCVEVDS